MDERIKKAHLKRAREQYNDEGKETPGSFEEFFQGQYTDEYGSENKKENPNSKVIKRYLGYLANTREGDRQEQPGLLGKVQTEGKGAYPANAEEDNHLLHQIMKFIHSEQIQGDIAKTLKTSPDNLTQVIAEISANIAAKLIFEVKKQRQVDDDAESAVLTIATEELFTMAKNMGMKKIAPDMVQNALRIGAGIYNQMEEGMKANQGQPPEQVPQLGGMPGSAQ